jgi:hypothetical protein
MLPHFKQKLARWGEEFGYDKIKIVEFESAIASETGIVGAMLGILGVDGSFAMHVAKSVQRQNESMSLEAAMILSSLNRQRPLFIGRKLGRQRTGTELHHLRGIPGQKFSIDVDMERKVRLASRPDMEWLKATFGCSLYQDLLTDELTSEDRANGATWGKSAIDHLAIMLSDLLNREYAQAMLAKAEAALKRNDFKKALDLGREALRVCPENAAIKAQIEALRSQTATARPAANVPVKKFKLLIDEPRKSDLARKTQPASGPILDER